MRCFLLSLAISLIGITQVCVAADLPFQPFTLPDGVLMIDRASGQNWILETGPHRPPGSGYVWKELPLPGVGMRGAGLPSPATRGPAQPPRRPNPGQPFVPPNQHPNNQHPNNQHPNNQHPGNQQPNHQPPGGPADPNGQMTPGPNGMMPPHMPPMSPPFMPGMPPQFWQAPHPGNIPSGSYSHAVPHHVPPSTIPGPPMQSPAEPQPQPGKVEFHPPAIVHQGDDVEKMDPPKGKANDPKPEDKSKRKKPKDKNKK